MQFHPILKHVLAHLSRCNKYDAFQFNFMNDNADFKHLTVSVLNAAAHRVQKIAYLLGAQKRDRRTI